jgi:cell division protein FtsB
VRRLTAELEDGARRRVAADMQAAHQLEGMRAEAAAARREVEVLRSGAGAAQEQALAALKVSQCLCGLPCCCPP